MDIKTQVIEIAKKAKKAAAALGRVTSEEKNSVLLRMAGAVVEQSDFLIAENAKDIDHAVRTGLPAAMIDRLTLSDQAIQGMAAGIREVAALPDPVGKITSMQRRPNGLLVGRMRIPLGVIGIIYESRPNVTADAAALCLKSGNAVILRGGSEAIHSNLAIACILQDVLKKSTLPEAAIQVIAVTDRAAVHELLQLDEHIDLIIPRGGEELIRAVVNQSR
ncbi:MAG: gamma-glutamyl-phosphate reductase, partial [Syntrophus sp. (in: bacteria)]|nr:gamma-glutamyl-phosphate reductase [Syntrophus sp. (in: bacteria)]